LALASDPANRRFFPAQSRGTYGAFDGIVVDLNASLIAIAHQGATQREGA